MTKKPAKKTASSKSIVGVPNKSSLVVEDWPIEKLTAYAHNPRKRGKKAVEKLAAAITEFGWRQPIVVDEDGVILVGHTRRDAALHLGLATVPVHQAVGLSEAQKRAYRIADNRLNEENEWDEDLLSYELKGLEGFDLKLTGFDLRQAGAYLKTGPVEGEDEVPAAPEQPTTRRGDLWLMGEHRLLCGDATSERDVENLMRGDLAQLCFTSPPYLNQRDYTQGKIDWLGLMRGVFAQLPTAEGGQVLVNLGLVHRDGEWIPYWEPWIAWMREQGWRAFGWYCWDQGPGLPGDWNGRLAPSFEFVFHFNREAEQARKTVATKWGGNTNHGKGLRAKDGSVTEYSHAGRTVQPFKIPDSVFRVMRHKARGIECSHPAVFPVQFAAEVIEAFSDAGNVVYEPMAGSGSQFLACERTSRRCYGLEIEPRYCDVIIQRWETFTGKKATLEADGRTFAEIKTERFLINMGAQDQMKEEILGGRA